MLLYQYPDLEAGQGAAAGAGRRRPTASRSPSATCELRGPGDFFGTRQSGLPTLRTGDLLRDHSLMEQARDEAARFLDEQTLDGAAAWNA